MEMKTETKASEASPQQSRSSTPRRRKNSRYRRTSSKKHTPTPQSSPYRCSKSRSKTPRKAVQSPLKLRGDRRQDEGKKNAEGEDEDENNGKDEDDNNNAEDEDNNNNNNAKDEDRDEARRQAGLILSDKLLADMEAEKRHYLGSSLRWAPLEERLFEILFLRQEIPLLPGYWEEYFLAIPMPEACYCWSKDMNPVVYAHADNAFRATVALTRLIDLTADIRTTCQSGLRSKAPHMIKRSLDKFLNWAAEDGGYHHLEYLPNITVEIVDKHSEDRPLTTFVEMRMRDLARSHREMLAIRPQKKDGAAEGDVDMEVESQIRGEAEASNEEQQQKQQAAASRSRSWRVLGSRVMSRLFRLIRRRSVIKPEYHGETAVIESDADEPMTVEQDTPEGDPVNVKEEDDPDEGIRVVIKKELVSESEDDITMADIPLASSSAVANSSSSPTLYHRPPPVIFGFFIISTTVILLTGDSSKDEAAMNLTLQFELDLEDRSLSIWNALTVAIVACLARDDMMKRTGDFEEARVVEESDPDA
ncbi:hypothetical protein J3F83DRAFT_457740 [Trichoderma novae-zelandiae]